MIRALLLPVPASTVMLAPALASMYTTELGAMTTLSPMSGASSESSQLPFSPHKYAVSGVFATELSHVFVPAATENASPATTTSEIVLMPVLLFPSVPLFYQNYPPPCQTRSWGNSCPWAQILCLSCDTYARPFCFLQVRPRRLNTAAAVRASCGRACAR